MNRLDVLYDETCGLCRRARDWAAGKPAFVRLEFLAAGSDEASRRYPTLTGPGHADELIVVSDEGAVYRNEAAWLICLYALEETREWSLRMGSPVLRPLARRAFLAVSARCSRLSEWLGLADSELSARLEGADVPACATGAAAPGLRPGCRPNTASPAPPLT